MKFNHQDGNLNTYKSTRDTQGVRLLQESFSSPKGDALPLNIATINKKGLEKENQRLY